MNLTLFQCGMPFIYTSSTYLGIIFFYFLSKTSRIYDDQKHITTLAFELRIRTFLRKKSSPIRSDLKQPARPKTPDRYLAPAALPHGQPGTDPEGIQQGAPIPGRHKPHLHVQLLDGGAPARVSQATDRTLRQATHVAAFPPAIL